MVIVSAITNPLDPTRRPVTCQMLSGLPVQHYIDAMLPVVRDDYDIAIGIDGHLVDWTPGMLVDDGRSLSIVVVPQGSGGGGKSLFKMVAMLGLALAAPYGLAAVGIGEMTAAGSFMIGGSTFLGGLATGAVTLAGALLMNAVLPVQTAGTTNYNSQSATYSWDVSANPVLEGAAVPVLFGRHRITPPRIGIYPEGSGENQTLNMLLAIAGHEVDSIEGVTVNETDIADYPEATTEIRLGANNQQVIQAFDDTRTIVPVDPAALLTTTAVTKTTLGNAFTKLAIGLSFPYGLYWMAQSGPNSTTVNVAIAYAVHGSNNWITLSSTSAAPITVSSPYWSAGYWNDVTNDNGTIMGQAWVELEAGSAVETDHIEGEKYTGSEDIWITSQYAVVNADAKPVLIWHWVADGTHVLPAGSDIPYVTISAASTSPLRYIFYTPALPAGNLYDIRVKLYDDPNAGVTETIDDCYWEYYEEILEDDFVYPNTALLAVRSVASNKLSGSVPRISCIAERSSVWVYDPALAVYVQKSATNHAWASYDILHGARRLVDINAAGYDPIDPGTWTYQFIQTGSVPHEKIIYDDFTEWADFIDLEHTDPVTGRQKKVYELNLYLDTTVNIRKALDLVGLGGRGLAVQQGSYWTCVIDKPEDTPIQRFGFNMATILKDSFTEEWTPTDQRANCIEATYYDAADDWSPKTVEMYQAGFDEMTDEVKKTSLDLRGFTDKDQATYFCQYQLNLNRYITLTASWRADVNAIACTRSQIVEVQHDVPQYGYGGRLNASCTTTVLNLDREITMLAGYTYHIIVYHIEEDLREEAAVVTAAGTASVITLSSALTRAPSQDSLWFFGQINKCCKLMRITDIGTGGDARRTIKAIEHVNEVYDDSATIPDPTSPSDLITQTFPPPLQSLDLEMVWKLDPVALTWSPFIRIAAIYNPDIDYSHLPIPIANVRAWVHIEDGDTTAAAVITPFEATYNWDGAIVDIPAYEHIGKTLYMTAALVNARGYTGTKTAVQSLYVTTDYAFVFNSSVEIAGYNWLANGKGGYVVSLSWAPYGWQSVGGKYAPVLTWNGGNNYYNFSRYMIIYGIVDAQGEIPAINAMMTQYTADIGNIYDAGGAMITDADQLDAICRNAACGQLALSYSDYWVAITVVPLSKQGNVSAIDGTQPDYGLDWEWIRCTMPGGTGFKVEEVEIQNAEFVYTMQSGTVFLCEMNWDYTLTAPFIDGFAIIYRAQPYQWAWNLASAVSSTETNFVTIIYSIDINTIGGPAAAEDFGARYAEWVANGIPFFYMLLSRMSEEGTEWECIKVDTQTLVATRGSEGSTARDWPVGSSIYYSPCEQIDGFANLGDSTARSFVFNPPLPLNFALHCTICAYKETAISPGYKRSHYAWWDAVELR